MATVLSLTEEKIQELMAGWEGIDLEQAEINALVQNLYTNVETNNAALTELENTTLPALQEDLDANNTSVSDLITNMIPNLELGLTQNTESIQDLNTVQIPLLQSDLASANNWIIELNETTLPDLNTRLDANDAALNTLNTVTLPDLDSRLTANETAVAGIDISGLQADLDAAEAAINTLNTTTLPALDTRLGTAETDVTALEGRFPITGPDIAANAVTANKIAADAVTATQIAAGAVTASEIAANTITANEIATGAITADEIAANAVVAVKIAADAVTAGKIAADAITAREIQADAITASEIAANAVTANEIAANAVVAGKIAADAVTATTIAAGAVTAGKIAADAVTANEIAANAVTTTELAAGAVTALKIATNTITANEIATDAITADKIAAGTITALEIATGTITAAQIATDTITTNEIATDTITANEIAGGTITANEIAGGTITAAQLASQVILASTKIAAVGAAGQSVEMNPSGFYVYGPTSEGNPAYISFPTDTSVTKPNIISGTLQATTLVVDGDANSGQAATFRRNSSIEPGATLQLNNATPPPIAGPSMVSVSNLLEASAVPLNGYLEGGGCIVSGEFFFPVTKSAGAGTYSNKIMKINLTTLVVTEVANVQYGATTTSKLLGLTNVGGTYYGVWYAPGTKTYYLSSFTINSGVWLTASGTSLGSNLTADPSLDDIREAVAIGNDGTSLWVASADYTPTTEGFGSAKLRFRKFATSNLSAVTETVNTSEFYGSELSTLPQKFTGLMVGNMDFGARKFVLGSYLEEQATGDQSMGRVNKYMWVKVYDTLGASDSTLDWEPFGGYSKLALLAWDGTRFWDVNRYTDQTSVPYMVSKYSRTFSNNVSSISAQTLYGWSTVYRTSDTAETAVSPVSSLNHKHRWWLKMTVATPPAGFVARFYVGTSSSSASSKRQAQGGTGVVSTTIDYYDSTLAAPGSGSISVGSSTPSQIKSQATSNLNITSIGVTNGSATYTSAGKFRDWMVGQTFVTSTLGTWTVVSVASDRNSMVVSGVYTGPTGTIDLYFSNQPKLMLRGDGSARIYEVDEIIISGNDDATFNAGNTPPLRVGNITGSHLRIDGDEIIAMTSDTGRGLLTLNQGSDVLVASGAQGRFRISGTGTWIKAMVVDSAQTSTNGTGIGSYTHNLGNTSYSVQITSRNNGQTRTFTVTSKNNNTVDFRVDNASGAAVTNGTGITFDITIVGV